MTELQSSPPRTRLDRAILPLSAIAALGQFEIAVSLPSLPAMAQSFGVSTSLIQLSVSCVYAGFGFVQLAGGVLVERFGRRPLATAGLLLFLAATVAAAVSTTTMVLMIARFFQGSGCALAIVAARSAARDRYEGPALGGALAALNIASALLSGVASAMGGILQDRLGWRSAFITAAVAGVAVLGLAVVSFPRTARAKATTSAWRGYRKVLTSSVFWGAMAVAVTMSVGEFALILSAPVIFEVQLGLSASQFGFLPPLILIAYSVGAVLAARLGGRWSDYRISLTATVLGVCSAGVLVALALSDRMAVLTVLPPMMFFVFCVGMAVPAATAMAVRPFGDIAGPATASMGVLLIVGVLLGSVVAALRLGGPTLSAALAMTVAAAAAIASLLLARGLEARSRKIRD